MSLHDEARESIKETINVLESENFSIEEFNIAIGKLFFVIIGIVKKEEVILLPSAMEVIDEDEWEEMNKQSVEYGFPFIERPEINRGERIEINGFKGKIGRAHV